MWAFAQQGGFNENSSPAVRNPMVLNLLLNQFTMCIQFSINNEYYNPYKVLGAPECFIDKCIQKLTLKKKK